MATVAAAGAEGRHAVFFPFPAQGHVKSALSLAQLLNRCHGFQVTFVHTEHNRRRLLRSRGPGALAGVPGFRFAAVPDGLPPSEADASQDMAALLSTTEALVPHFRSLVSGLLPPASCVISDIEHILRASKEMGLRCVTFWTTSAFAFMASQQLQRLVDMGIARLPGRQLVEFAWGLANSKKDFLWAIRNDQVNDCDGPAAAVMPPEFLEETKARSHVTSWCPQEAVLRHEATGAFLTQCGWNSVLESLSAGVPMLCWPFGADQYTNARYVCSEWRVGLEIDGDVKRGEVEAAVKEVMEGVRGKEMKRLAMEWKEKATAAAAMPGGPSWVLEKVVNEVLAVQPSKISDTTGL